LLHHLVVLRHEHLLIVDILELVLVLELLHLMLEYLLLLLVVLIEVHHLRLLKHLLLGLLLLELKNRLGLLRGCLLHLERRVAVGRLYHRSVDELVLEPLALILILLHHWLLILHRWLLNCLVELRQLELRVVFLFGLDRLYLL
jgi:hypothetical protein